MIGAALIEKKWLYRRFEVLTPEGVFEIAYDGRGLGYESVLVEGKPVSAKQSLWWFAPEIDFRIGDSRGKIKVQIWSWYSIKSLSLEIDDKVLYLEE